MFDIDELKEMSKTVRLDVINMLADAGSGHPGGSLSIVDILTVLYFNVMDLREGHDKFVLSKGHGAPALYAVLANKKIISRDELKTFRKFGSRLQGHPDSLVCPGVETSTGSLGQGVSIAVGLCIGKKIKNECGKVYVLVGDGEMQEGQIWEALMSASHYNLDNLVVIVDNNGLQIDGSNDEVMSLGQIDDKFKAFGFSTEVINGHNYLEIKKALSANDNGKPLAIIAKTIKGKGVSFMENDVNWHGATVHEDERIVAINEVRAYE